MCLASVWSVAFRYGLHCEELWIHSESISCGTYVALHHAIPLHWSAIDQGWRRSTHLLVDLQALLWSLDLKPDPWHSKTIKGFCTPITNNLNYKKEKGVSLPCMLHVALNMLSCMICTWTKELMLQTPLSLSWHTHNTHPAPPHLIPIQSHRNSAH